MFGLVHHPFAGEAAKVLPAHDYLTIVAHEKSVAHSFQVVGGSLVHRDVHTFGGRVPATNSLV